MLSDANWKYAKVEESHEERVRHSMNLQKLKKSKQDTNTRASTKILEVRAHHTRSLQNLQKSKQYANSRASTKIAKEIAHNSRILQKLKKSKEDTDLNYEKVCYKMIAVKDKMKEQRLIW